MYGISTGKRRVRASAGLAVVSLGLMGALAACAGTVASPATSPASSVSGSPGGGQAVCDDVEALRTAVDDLQALDITAVGTDGLTAAVDEVRTAGSALRESAGSELAPSVTAFETALAGLATTLQQTPQGSIGSGATADAIRSAISEVQTAASDLRSQLATTGCPS